MCVFACIRRLADKLLDLHTHKSERTSFASRVSEAHPLTHHGSNCIYLVHLPISLVYQAESSRRLRVVIQSRGVCWEDTPGLPLFDLEHNLDSAFKKKKMPCVL